MERQIFGFTPPNPETGQPGYLAAHLVEAPEGTHVNVTVRPHAQENAAPDLLAACRRVDWVFGSWASAEDHPEEREAIAMLRAAIARADGKGVPPLTGEMATRIARAGREEG